MEYLFYIFIVMAIVSTLFLIGDEIAKFASWIVRKKNNKRVVYISRPSDPKVILQEDGQVLKAETREK